MEGNGTSASANGSQHDISVIKVKGYLDLITAEELDRAISSVLKTDCFRIIVDLKEVDYICSSGWGVFLGSIKQVRENGGDLKLAHMKPDVYEVYRVLEFFWFLKSYETIEAAAADFDKDPEPV
ncbi:MAG: anti-sigma factor antagonist [Calditrichaeota bacterium]|nr:MAG: anti-sigma factor antagonist [Calditrichota bacterium]